MNKVETKVVLVFDLNTSAALSAEQIDVLNEVLKNRISRKGQIQIVAQKYKSQLKNKNLANQKFIDLLIQSLKPSASAYTTRAPQIALLVKVALSHVWAPARGWASVLLSDDEEAKSGCRGEPKKKKKTGQHSRFSLRRVG